MRRMTTALIVGLCVLAAAPAVAADNATLHRGMEVFQKWCAPCHAPGPKHPGTQALAALYKGKKPAALEKRTDLTPQLVSYFVRNGVSVMTPFRKTEIGDADLAALGAYLSQHSK